MLACLTGEAVPQPFGARLDCLTGEAVPQPFGARLALLGTTKGSLHVYFLRVLTCLLFLSCSTLHTGAVKQFVRVRKRNEWEYALPVQGPGFTLQ